MKREKQITKNDNVKKSGNVYSFISKVDII